MIIAQGWEAGGHNYGGLGTMALVPAMLNAVGNRSLVLASGGVADARGVAGALALGADGVWVGTRLVASKEANVHPEHHRRLLASNGGDTVRSGVFGPEMPDFNPMRLLRCRIVDEFTDRLEEVPTQREDKPVIGKTKFLGQPHTKRRFDFIRPHPKTLAIGKRWPGLPGKVSGCSATSKGQPRSLVK